MHNSLTKKGKKMKKTKMLKKNYEFKNVLAKGKYYSGEKIEAFIAKNNKNYNTLGLAIGVKRGKANQRNKIKRLLRENYRKLEGKIQEGNSIVFLSKKSEKIEETTYNQIKSDMQKIFEKAKILKKEE